MIDLHAHILPGIDDGPSTLEEAVAMARLAVADGITGICCTPHTLNGQFITEADTVLNACSQLQQELTKKKIPLELYPGGEIHITDSTLESIVTGKSLTLNNTGKYVLLEPPPLELPTGLDNPIYHPEVEWITPILAHPERVATLLYSLDELYPLVEEGLICQVTALSVTGEFGPQIQQTAQTMICCGLAHIIASDTHAETGRIPRLSMAIEQAADWLGSLDAAEKLCMDNPGAVISGHPLHLHPPSRPVRPSFGKKIKHFFFA